MKARPMKIIDEKFHDCDPSEATHVEINIPGKYSVRVLPLRVNDETERNFWTWNGDIEKPTLSPSVSLSYGIGHKCHSWVTDGMVKFLNDSTHENVGKSIELEDIPEFEDGTIGWA